MPGRIHATAVLSVAIIALMAVTACSGGDRPDRFILATTHTLEDSGLLDTLTARYAVEHPGQRMDVVVAGSGEVLAIGERGDADVLLTHAPEEERAFVEAGHGTARIPVMHNTFVIAGPTDDSAGVAMANSAADAFTRIARSTSTFVSRGDDSGTHHKELSVWALAGTKPAAVRYIEAGAGMADALRVASERRAYILTDIATFLTIKDRLDLELLYQGDAVLRNEYSLIVVATARNPSRAAELETWITSAPVQQRIGQFGRSAFGRPLFIPDAGK